ncbi:hypothetical protein J7L13_02610 [bacterium]|nr:hypothetical protein [bacterium]
MQAILPVVYVEARTLPEAWERAVLETWEKGVSVKTQYDKPSDPPSRDAIAVIVVVDPLAEPRIHRAMPGGLEDLAIYVEEVVRGVHDYWINPEEGKWSYTYHQRLFGYPLPSSHLLHGSAVDQIELIIEQLAKAPYSRRAQAITWQVWQDPLSPDPPCLQRIWCRVVDGKLCMNIHMRSNDAFKAAFMNMYAFVELQRLIAERLSERLGEEIPVGQYTHIADSFHIYGSYFEEFERFLETLKKRTFKARTFRSDDPMIKDIMEEARRRVWEEREKELRGDST